MMRGNVVPDLGRVDIEAIPIADELFAPIPIPPLKAGWGLDAEAWLVLVVHVSAISTYYSQGHFDRLHDRLSELSGKAQLLAGQAVGTAFVRDVATRANVVATQVEGYPGSGEALWWVMALRAAFALSAWYGMAGMAEDEETQRGIWDLCKSLRLGVRAMYPSPVGEALLEIATGAAAPDFLRLVAAEQVRLDPTRPMGGFGRAS